MKAILVGFDAFDPGQYEKLHNEGKTPNLSRYVERQGYARFGVANPPQSEVSWTSIATGKNPGGHGMFDFVHRNPKSYGLHVSLLPTKGGMLGSQFTPPHSAETIFEAAVKEGYPATSLWWPATFPAKYQSPVRTIPGLGVPDIFGQLGVGISYAMEAQGDEKKLKTRTGRLSRKHIGVYGGTLAGPVQQGRGGMKTTELDFELSVIDDGTVRLKLGKHDLEMKLGAWSPVIEIGFKVGWLMTLKVVTRVIVTAIKPEPVMYFLPLQLHPLNSPWPYGTPKGMLKEIWKGQGAYLTLGWPQDTTALEEGFINDEQFLALCEQILAQRERIFNHLLEGYREGVLGCVFDSLDRVQHMFWKTRPDVIEDWYVKLDRLAGRIVEKVKAKPGGEGIGLMFVSDHGFQDYEYKANLNRWLVERGYLKLRADAEEQKLTWADWEQSLVYAIGLNSVYLNVAGREGKGTVAPEQKTEVQDRLKDELLKWVGPDGRAVVQNVYSNAEAFSGPLALFGPDLVVGYAPGYRASSETGLGGMGETAIEANKDHWGADHCIDVKAVPGVIFAGRGLTQFPEPTYADIPAMTIGRELEERTSAEPVGADEDQEALEERLKGLGYL